MRFNSLKAIEALLFSGVLLFFTSCDKKFDYQIQDDVLYTLLQPSDVEGMEQRGDSLYHAGQISDLCRKFYHAYPLYNKHHQFNDAVPIFREMLKDGSEDSLERLFQMYAASELTMILRYQGHVETSMLTAIDAMQRFSFEEALTDQTALESYIRLGTFVGDGMVSTGDFEEAEKQFLKFYNLSNDMKAGVIRLAEWYPRHFELFEIIIRAYTTSPERSRIICDICARFYSKENAQKSQRIEFYFSVRYSHLVCL